MKRILYFEQDPIQSTSYWRGMGVMTDLMRAYPGEFEVVAVGEGEVLWPDVRRADALWLERPADEQYDAMIRMAEDNGVPVVVDWDDLIFDIPIGNHVRNWYTRDRIQLCAGYMARANLVTVSTGQLRESFAARGLKTPMHVIPNVLPQRMEWPAQGPATKTVLWRGSQTHDGDIEEVTGGIVRLASEFPDWRWVFAGWDPWRLTRHLPRESWATFGVQTMANYHKTCIGLCPGIVMSPLVDNEFNRCKSNIGAIEADLFGARYVTGSGDVFINALRDALSADPADMEINRVYNRSLTQASMRGGVAVKAAREALGLLWA